MQAEAAQATSALHVYGLDLRVEGDWPEVVEAVAKDFAWFSSPAAATGGERVIVQRRPPDFDSIGPLTASFVTPRNVVYADGDRQVVDYFGRALCVVDRRTGTATVQGTDAHLVHEAAYLYLLSRVGRHLDGRRLTRLHALALSGVQGVWRFCSPRGVGRAHWRSARCATRPCRSSPRTPRCSTIAGRCTRFRSGSG